MGDGPEGLELFQEVVTPEEEAALIALIEAETLSYYAMDPGNPRSSVSFGWKYDFTNDSFVPCAPVPQGFGMLCATAARFARLTVEDFAECLVNRYEPGAMIQPHKDKPVWERIIGISLGSAETMVFQDPARPADRYEIALPPRSMYLMSGPARHTFHHSLPRVEGTRWSITLRSFSPEGAKLRDRHAAHAVH